MRDNLKKVIGGILLLMLVLAAVSTFFQSHRADNIQQAIAETRRAMREQGFKTDLTDFNFTTDAATHARAAELIFSSGYLGSRAPAAAISLLPAVADGSAVVIWKQDWLKAENDTVTWTDVHDALEEHRPELDAACDAALSGPIQFDLDASRGNSMLLPHLVSLRNLGQMLGTRTVAELHAGNPDAAWTNLLALTHLSTAWNVEPVEVSHLVQFWLVGDGFNATWQALQQDHWPDEKLATLQREWESLDLFTNLPDVVAFKRASDVALCQQERQRPMTTGMPISEIIKESMRAPGAAVTAIKQSWTAGRYRSYGTFEDEKNMLLFYQNREIETRNAIACSTWAQMQAMPGVTNPPVFTSPYHSAATSIMAVRARSVRFMTRESSLLARAAIAETRRRIIITAIALERFRQKHGAYPKALDDLTPEFLKAAPVDFMDGRPLRYRLTDDGRFVVYSVGLGGIDSGGKLPLPTSRATRGTGLFPASEEGDIVWPLPADEGAVAAQNEREADAVRAKADEVEDLQAKAQWGHTARRQANVDELLAAPAVTNISDVKIGGRYLSEILHNPQSAGKNKLSLVEMLRLRQVITGDEPEKITFELPIAYDAITNIGQVHLYIDPTNTDESDMGCDAMHMDCTRATNGNCLLAWSTIYETPGRHALQAGLSLEDLPPDKQDFDGPLLPFTITNLCQFSIASATYDPAIGAGLHALLPEANASYLIELNTTNGERIKTISGSTTNSELKIFWNLMDDHGRRFGGDDFNSVFHLTFPESGRTQTFRGP